MSFNKIITILFALVLTVAGLHAQDNSSTRKKHFNTEETLAIQGYDPVSYFTDKKPAKGSSKFVYTHLGVTYRFTSSAHLETFKLNPIAYEPQYGGWCAYAMGNTGEKVEVDPKTFKIIQGKLYLFYNKYFTNTLTSWNKNEPTLLSAANKNWMKTFK